MMNSVTTMKFNFLPFTYMTDLITINPEEFGLDKTEAEQVRSVFIPMLESMKELETEYNEIIKLTPTIENCKKAKVLRWKLVKVRTGTAEIHKKAKAYYLNGGRAVDAFKNVVTFSIQWKETELEKLENHFENIEKERIAKLQQERLTALSQYVEDISALQLGTMPDDVWNAYFESKKKDYNDKIEAEKKVEADRIESERKQKEEQEKMKADNERLRQEAEAREAQMKKEREESERKQKELEAKARQEAEAREKLEKEKRDAEKKIEDERIAKEQKEKADLANKELMEKKQKYVEYRSSFGYSEDTKSEFIEKTENWVVTIFKKVWEFKI